MTCPHCLKEVPPASAACPFCGLLILSGDPLPATTPAAPPPYPVPAASPPAPPPPSTALRILAVLLGIICMIPIVLIASIIARKTHPVMDAQGIGFLVGTCIGVFIFPVIGILLYAKLNKRKHVPAYLFAATCVFALVWSVGNLGIQSGKHISPNQDEVNERVAKLAKEGVGQAPNSGNKNDYDDILRSLFADVKKFNEDYNAEIAANDSSALASLYKANSYGTDASISRVLSQLHSALTIDEKYASMQPIIQKTKDRLDASSMSESTKQEFWKGFDGSMQQNMGPRNDVIAKERLWLKDSIELYEFMQANEKSFHIKNDKIVFATDELLATFNAKAGKVDSERQDFLTTQKAFQKAQQEKLGKLGLKQSDFDAPETKK